MPKPFVMANLDRPRRLRYTMNALVNLEELLGRPFFDVLQDFGAGHLGLRELRGILWAGLIHEDPDLTVEQAGALLDEAGDLQTVALQIGEALQAAFGLAKNATGPAANGAAGTGTQPSA